MNGLVQLYNYSHGNSSSKGTAICFRKKLDIENLEIIYKSVDGRAVILITLLKHFLQESVQGMMVLVLNFIKPFGHYLEV